MNNALKRYGRKGEKQVAYEFALKRDDSVPLEFFLSALKCGCGCGAMLSPYSRAAYSRADDDDHEFHY